MPSMRDVADRSRLMRPNPGDLPGKLAFYRWAGWYLKHVKAAFAHTAASPLNTVKTGWASPALDAAGWRREFMLALHRRINAKGGVEPRGRKTDTEYWWRMKRDARRLRDWFQFRVAIHGFESQEARKRFSHLIFRGDV